MSKDLCEGCAMRRECAEKPEEEREQQRWICEGKEEDYYDDRS